MVAMVFVYPGKARPLWAVCNWISWSGGKGITSSVARSGTWWSMRNGHNFSLSTNSTVATPANHIQPATKQPANYRMIFTMIDATTTTTSNQPVLSILILIDWLTFPRPMSGSEEDNNNRAEHSLHFMNQLAAGCWLIKAQHSRWLVYLGMRE